jgi:hypothetical protein
MSKSETKNVSGMADAVAGTRTYENTITNDDGSQTSARGNSAEEAQQKASDKNKS